MSEEQLKAFLEAVKADAGLQEQLKAAGDADAVVAIAKAAGFVISFEAVAKLDSELSELSDAELESAAGGTDRLTYEILKWLNDGLETGFLGNCKRESTSRHFC